MAMAALVPAGHAGARAPARRPVRNRRRTGGAARAVEVEKQQASAKSGGDADAEFAAMMESLRGANLNDDDFADEATTIAWVDDVGGRSPYSSSVDAAASGASYGAAGELPLVYDPEAIAAYWSVRPVAVAKRVAQIFTKGGPFLAKVVGCAITNKLEANEARLAGEFRDIVTSLGPAYIKLAQALSIRPDILSPTAMNELQLLCDKVPSFDNDVAMATLANELGVDSWRDVYSELTPRPIAAASLGQVYKGVLKDNGDTVAVKVQRPFVRETVSIDLYLLRRIGLLLREDAAKEAETGTDLVALLDEWALRFFEELDYVNEGENGERFFADMSAELPQVVVPRTYLRYTTRQVLTCSWVEGEKLSRSEKDDVGDLVNVGVICFLTQLLDTGHFHSDPHPGNLIRTPEGRLAVIDYGLMTEVDDEFKYGMIEAIAHLIQRDYEAILDDFVTLEFIPEGTDLRPILPALSKVFDQALEGGGAKSINFQELAADLAQVTFDFPFRIPPVFALIIRSIGVLEGIALKANPKFALVDEAYPYIAQKLLTDDTPRMREALRYLIYGKSGVFDAERIIDLLVALESFEEVARFGVPAIVKAQAEGAGPEEAASAAVAALPSAAQPAAQRPAYGDALAFVLSDRGALFRELLLDEAAKGLDAYGRYTANLGLLALGLKDVRLPVLLPGSTRRSIAIAPTLTEEDELILYNAEKVLRFLGGRLGGSSAAASMDQSEQRKYLTDVVVPALPALAFELLPELGSKLASRTTARFLREAYL